MDYVWGLKEVDPTRIALVGGKGARLAELSHLDGIGVPIGYCVTTDAFRRVMAAAPSLDERLDQLSRLNEEDRDGIRALSAEIRNTIEGVVVPDDLAVAITRPLARPGAKVAYAVRSSAAAEDSPTASFAGQHATYLDVVGPAAILQHVSRCWASLFSEAAVTYRLRNGFDQRTAQMAVVVQRLVCPDVAGVLFTADPVSGNRKVICVEAGFGLGEALVSGLTDADVYRIRGGELIEATIATKPRGVYPAPTGGTQVRAIEPERQDEPALTDAQALRLAQLGRRIEAHFGTPQDIEWCRVDEDFQIVQSRPITTLFPVPAVGDDENHVYVSVGHQQMMTDPMKPLGLSLFQLTARPPMYEAGGRLFVDVTQRLASPTSRADLLEVLGNADPLIGDALRTIVERGDFLPTLPDQAPGASSDGAGAAPIATDPALLADLIERSLASLTVMKRDIQTKSGEALFDFILADVQELRRILFDPQSFQVIMASMEATSWLNEQLHGWLGEQNAADTLTQSVPGNVTSEMGLALMDVADVIRPYPEVVAFLRHVEDDSFLDGLAKLAGGREARDAIAGYLDQYGVRCVGEIDITRPRWSERPTTLAPVLLGNIENFEPDAAQRRFAQGRQQAWDKERELLERLRALPDGERKAGEAMRMIDRVRTFAGYREYPKYAMVSRYFVYKQALLKEAGRLVQAHVLGDKEDIFFLTFPELHDLVRTHRVDDQLIRQRTEAFSSYQALTPPRVLTSDGEVIAGAYRRDDVPAGALVGLAVSGGIVEGRARVVSDLAEADLGAGDILVTAYTDPSWSPVFVAVQGLVTEVGGLMTHGSVIAREYGLPAVVGVEHATRLIRDGQHIRVHGTDGYVEILPPASGRETFPTAEEREASSRLPAGDPPFAR